MESPKNGSLLITKNNMLRIATGTIKKYLEEKTLRDVLYNLLDYLTVIPVDVDVLKKGLRSKHKDFEDAIQILCASSVEKMDCIVTRNTKDFRDCEILVLTPDELCIRF